MCLHWTQCVHWRERAQLSARAGRIWHWQVRDLFLVSSHSCKSLQQQVSRKYVNPGIYLDIIGVLFGHQVSLKQPDRAEREEATVDLSLMSAVWYRPQYSPGD